ncbi:uncharacterized protein ARMOST_06250 [Armillaria ostoyae]|uniref:Uncharacterized protein n=1 Tax=Armillaria ostoyae TaxID=47428 RepID=A0A284R2F8_ARMOS|nr:uncharacterized protein ARMOST_06250 [Armillaria ostoyae]
MDYNLAVHSGDQVPFFGNTQAALTARIFVNRERTLYLPNAGAAVFGLWERTPEEQATLGRYLLGLTQSLGDRPDLDDPNLHQETFGGFTSELPGEYKGYTFTLPDSPPHHPIRRQGQYYGPKTSHLLGGANNGAGGSNEIPVDPTVDEPTQTPAERVQAAKDLAAHKAERIRQMREALDNEVRAHDTHVEYWNLPNAHQGRKGKEPN